MGDFSQTLQLADQIYNLKTNIQQLETSHYDILAYHSQIWKGEAAEKYKSSLYDVVPMLEKLSAMVGDLSYAIKESAQVLASETQTIEEERV